jgi:hypothetical protein
MTQDTSDGGDAGRLEGTHAWIRPGAIFVEEGEAKRITKITGDIVHGVSSAGHLWRWPLAGFLAAVDSGRIQQTTLNRPQRAPKPRQRLYLSETARKRLDEIRSHPLVLQSGDGLPRLMLRTLQALRQGEPAEPPALLSLLLVAEAGAEAQNLGRLVAFPERKGGRRSRNAHVAQEVQLLLARFAAWMEGDGNFSLADTQRVEALVEAGLRAIRFPDLADEPGPGRPQERFHSVQHVRARLARRWRDHKRGIYKLSGAIRETAEQEVLNRERAAAAWQGKSPDLVALDDGDADDLRVCYARIESAYHSMSSRLPMTVEERLMYRRYAAMLRRASRSLARRSPR